MSGKKNGSSVTVRYDGPAGAMIWRHEKEYFPAGAKAEVGSGQEAVVVADGSAPKLLAAGTHALGSAGRDGVLHCRLFFVNKGTSLKLTWGTDAPIRMTDPRHGVDVSLRAHGSYSVQVENSELLVSKLEKALNYNDTDDLLDALAPSVAGAVGAEIPKTVRAKNIDCRNFSADSGVVAASVAPKVGEKLKEYGLKLTGFDIEGAIVGGFEEIGGVITKNVVRQMEAEGEASVKTTRARAKADEKIIISQADNQVRLESAAVEAESQRMKAVTAQFADAGAGQTQYPGVMPGDQSGFGGYAEMPAAEALDPVSARLEELQRMLDAGQITPEEYQAECEKLI